MMPRISSRFFSTAFALCLIASANTHAQDAAAEPEATVTPTALDVPAEAEAGAASKSPDQRLTDLLQHRTEIKRGGPIAGVVLSSVGIGAGATFLAIGIATRVGDSDAIHGKGAATATAVLGGAVVVGSVVGLVFSAKRLKERNQLIKSVDREIKTLQAQGAQVSVVHGAAQPLAVIHF